MIKSPFATQFCHSFVLLRTTSEEQRDEESLFSSAAPFQHRSHSPSLYALRSLPLLPKSEIQNAFILPFPVSLLSF